MLIGYARVSTIDQTLALQQDALTAAGCEQLYTDTVSGSVTTRPGLTPRRSPTFEQATPWWWQSSGLKRTTGLSAVLTCRDAPRGRAYEAQSVALQGPPDWAERPTRLTGGAQPVRSSSSTQATLAIDQCARQLVPRDAGFEDEPLTDS